MNVSEPQAHHTPPHSCRPTSARIVSATLLCAAALLRPTRTPFLDFQCAPETPAAPQPPTPPCDPLPEGALVVGGGALAPASAQAPLHLLRDDASLAALHLVHGRTLSAALGIAFLRAEPVTFCFVAADSDASLPQCRWYFEVGKYVCIPPHQCSCTAFRYQVVQRHAADTCKHLLAIELLAAQASRALVVAPGDGGAAAVSCPRPSFRTSAYYCSVALGGKIRDAEAIASLGVDHPPRHAPLFAANARDTESVGPEDNPIRTASEDWMAIGALHFAQQQHQHRVIGDGGSGVLVRRITADQFVHAMSSSTN